MVKELEITDWDPLEIAAMIEHEISLLVPNWKPNVSSLQPHSFSNEDDEDNDEGGGRTRLLSSASFSHDSPVSPVAVRDNNDMFSNDMVQGNSWMRSSTDHYSPSTDDDQSPQRRRRARLQKMRTLVDTRTQVLHQSLMELINKRRGRGSYDANANTNELHYQPSTDYLRRP